MLHINYWLALLLLNIAITEKYVRNTRIGGAKTWISDIVVLLIHRYIKLNWTLWPLSFVLVLLKYFIWKQNVVWILFFCGNKSYFLSCTKFFF